MVPGAVYLGVTEKSSFEYLKSLLELVDCTAGDGADDLRKRERKKNEYGLKFV